MTRTLTILTLLLATGAALAAGARPAPDATARPEREAVAGSTSEGETTTTDDALSAVAATDGKDAKAAEGSAEDGDGGPKRISGMSVLGNREAPKSLVIVPWKSSRIGDGVGISAMLDDGRGPVDREVFLRALSYWEIRSEGGR